MFHFNAFDYKDCFGMDDDDNFEYQTLSLVTCPKRPKNETAD
jgi:hypothetical protein